MIIVLTGMSSAGKDTIRKELEYRNYINIVSHTSRPPRVNENEGKDYYFVSQKEFEDMIDNNEMIEYRNYEVNWNGRGETWFYGIKKFNLEKEKNYVVVMDLGGAESITRYFGEENCIIIYITAPYDIREKRAIKRGSFDSTEWNRRMLADYKDFSSANLKGIKNRHRVWEIDNGVDGYDNIIQIADVIEFIQKGRIE